jgi:hypothetical protein
MTVKTFTYEEKKEIANKYLDAKTDGNTSWDDLPDINSLHDAETVRDVEDLCDERLEDSGFYIDFDSFIHD